MKPLKKAVRLYVWGDIQEDVDHREGVRKGGGDHDMGDVNPDALARFRMRQYIATLNCPSLLRRREERTVGTALEPPPPDPCRRAPHSKVSRGPQRPGTRAAALPPCSTGRGVALDRWRRPHRPRQTSPSPANRGVWSPRPPTPAATDELSPPWRR